MRDVIDLLESGFAREAAGGAVVFPKYVTDFESGAMRILFATDETAVYAAMKAYHRAHGRTRYMVTPYSLKNRVRSRFWRGNSSLICAPARAAA